jgi:hypothetical protein
VSLMAMGSGVGVGVGYRGLVVGMAVVVGAGPVVEDHSNLQAEVVSRRSCSDEVHC